MTSTWAFWLERAYGDIGHRAWPEQVEETIVELQAVLPIMLCVSKRSISNKRLPHTDSHYPGKTYLTYLGAVHVPESIAEL